MAVIYYPLLFIPFKAVKESCFPVSFGKQSKSVWLYFSKQTFPAIPVAFIAVTYAAFKRASAVFAPIFVGTFSRIAAAAYIVFRAKTAGKPASCYSKLPFHFIVLLLLSCCFCRLVETYCEKHILFPLFGVASRFVTKSSQMRVVILIAVMLFCPGCFGYI